MRIAQENSKKTSLKKIRIAARHSDLARLQAYRVGDAMKAAHEGLEIEYAFRASLGDVNQSDPLWKMPEKGVFTEDFLRDLTEGAADLVVHSWKDLPTEMRPDTAIVATLPRADVRDVLLFRKDRLGAAKASGRVRILTSSPRRAHNLGGFLRDHLPFEVNDLGFDDVRGNIPTRLKKLLAQDCDGLIVAKAAIDRLLQAPEAEFGDVRSVIRETLAQVHFMVLPLTVNPTAAAQGALAVEIRRDRNDLREALSAIHSEETFAAVEKERQILASYGGGCHQKIGVNVLPKAYGEVTFLRGLTDQGEVLDRVGLARVDEAHFSVTAQTSTYPKAGESPVFFEREALPRTAWAWAEAETFLWVARETALPTDFNVSASAIVWVAGLKTWRKLAERGVWVSGSSESLGEDEATNVETMVQVASISWVKLTHSTSERYTEEASKLPGVRLCATYSLNPKQSVPDLRGRTHFYWMSASSFERALELYPDAVRSGHHACGPGLTYKHIRRVLGPNTKVQIELTPPSWAR